MSTSQTNPITFPIEVEVKFKCRVDTVADYEYLTSTVPELSIIKDAKDLFDEVAIKCIECNGVKL